MKAPCGSKDAQPESNTVYPDYIMIVVHCLLFDVFITTTLVLLQGIRWKSGIYLLFKHEEKKCEGMLRFQLKIQ